MRKNQFVKGNIQLRQTILREAARLMYEEGVGQYYTAKWRAAKRVLGQGGKKVRSIRTRDLPSNGEISQALFQLAQLYEGNTIQDRLFAMRISALEIMEKFEQFCPRLIGSVSTGRIKKTSDIDLHLFTDHIEILESHINLLGWPYERDQITIKYNGKFREFTHFYLEHEFPLELSVYPLSEIRVRGRSSTDGKPIVRLSYEKLLRLIEQEHASEWDQYLSFGESGVR